MNNKLRFPAAMARVQTTRGQQRLDGGVGFGSGPSGPRLLCVLFRVVSVFYLSA